MHAIQDTMLFHKNVLLATALRDVFLANQLTWLTVLLLTVGENTSHQALSCLPQLPFQQFPNVSPTARLASVILLLIALRHFQNSSQMLLQSPSAQMDVMLALELPQISALSQLDFMLIPLLHLTPSRLAQLDALNAQSLELLLLQLLLAHNAYLIGFSIHQTPQLRFVS